MPQQVYSAGMAVWKPRPVQLVVIAVSGAFVAASTWLIPLLPLPHVHGSCLGLWQSIWANRLLFLAMVVPFVGGIAPMLWAERRLKRGLLDDAWLEDELTGARSMLDRPGWGRASVVLFLACLFVVVTKDGGHSAFFYFYLLMMPTQVVYRMRQMIALPTVAGIGMQDWQNFKPIRSEHWGDAPGREQLPS